jgi:oxalate decarboxylase
MPLTGNVAEFPFKNNVPDPLLSGKELPTFKFALEKSAGKVDGGSFGKEATVEQLPISKGIAGVSMRLEPGVTRELHWHATAAEWALAEGRVRTTVVDLPAAPRSTTSIRAMSGISRAVMHIIACLDEKPSFHPDFRQWIFLRVRHLQYYRLAGSRLEDWAWVLVATLRIPQRKLTSFMAACRRRHVALQGALVAAFDPQIPTAGTGPHSIHKFGRVGRRQPLSDIRDHDGSGSDLDPGAVTQCTVLNTDEWQYVVSRLQRHAVRLHGRTAETLMRGRRHSAGLRHSIEVSGKAGRILIGLNTGNYQAIDLSQWMAGTPSYVLADHFGKPQDVFERFPKARAFIAPPDGMGQREIK